MVIMSPTLTKHARCGTHPHTLLIVEGLPTSVALMEAMVDAIRAHRVQQSRPAPAAEARQGRPERPEPRFKVGDVVRASVGVTYTIAKVEWRGGRWVCTDAQGFGGDEDALTLVTPAPDPVRDEARRLWEACKDAKPSELDMACGRDANNRHALRVFLAVDGHAPDLWDTWNRRNAARARGEDPDAEAWHEKLVRLAREAEERRIAYETAAKAEENAERFAADAHKAMLEAERAFAEATEASAILAAGGGK